MHFHHSLKNFTKHFFKGKSDFFLHSPFIFQLYRTTIRNKNIPEKASIIETKRKELLSDHTLLEGTDFGTGNQSTRKVSKIAKSSLSTQRECLFFYHLGQFINAKKVLELGTSLGITSAYLSLFADHVITIEGHKGTVDYASTLFKDIKSNNIILKSGSINDHLPQIINQHNTLDFVLIDAHHDYDHTIEYFNMILPSLHNNSVVIVDDIYWSPEMTAAWNVLKENLAVTVSIDFYHFGVLFFRKEQVKEHFRLLLSPLL